MRLQYDRYVLGQGVSKIKTRAMLIMSAAVLTLGSGSVAMVSMLGSSSALASGDVVSYTAVPFNLGEWGPDRTAPSGGDSLLASFASRSGVLEMNVDTDNQSGGASFYYTEGLKHDLSGVTAVKADLYVDSGWTGNNTRAGIWGVGDDGSGGITAYPIMEYTVSSNANGSGYTGWRSYDDQIGAWIQHPSLPVNLDGWNTVAIEFNSSTSTFDFVVNGVDAGSSVATGSVNLSAVILNQYNYGALGQNYSVHWSNFMTGVVSPLNNKDQCKKDGWKNFNSPSFKNQGQCVSFVERTKHL